MNDHSHDANNQTGQTHVELDQAITRALEQQPSVTIPTDFADRVRASLPAAPAPRRSFHVGRTIAIAASVVLTIAVFAVAPHAAPNFTSLAFDLELLMLAELGGIAYWFVGRKQA